MLIFLTRKLNNLKTNRDSMFATKSLILNRQSMPSTFISTRDEISFSYFCKRNTTIWFISLNFWGSASVARISHLFLCPLFYPIVGQCVSLYCLSLIVKCLIAIVRKYSREFTRFESIAVLNNT